MHAWFRLSDFALPFQRVGDIAEFRGDQCDWNQRAKDDPQRWLLIQACTHITLPVKPWEKRQGITREIEVAPLQVIAFETEPGEGCEPANFGLCRFPSKVSHPEFGKLQTKLKGWSWSSFCKTHYASDPRCGQAGSAHCGVSEFRALGGGGPAVVTGAVEGGVEGVDAIQPSAR